MNQIVWTTELALCPVCSEWMPNNGPGSVIPHLLIVHPDSVWGRDIRDALLGRIQP